MSISIDSLTHDQLAQVWPHVGQELADFADYLAKNNSPGTADQLRLAIQMANRHFQVINAVTPTLTTLASAGQNTSLLPQGQNLADSLSQVKNVIAMVQKFYQIFTAIMSVIEPLIESQPAPTPAPAPAPPLIAGKFVSTIETPDQDKPT